MTKPRPKLVVIGAGGHAKVAIETLVEAGHYEIAGLLDQDPTPRTVLGFEVLGKDDQLELLRQQGITHAFPAIGNNILRVKLGSFALSRGYELANAISPHAHVSPSANLGSGVLVVAGAIVNAEARIGDMVILNTRSSVDHDCHIGKGAHVAPGAALAGQVRLGPLGFVGVGASILPGITIGEAAMIGAGACVIRDIPAGELVYGVPARPASRQEA